jgi:hypothetical protein
VVALTAVPVQPAPLEDPIFDVVVENTPSTLLGLVAPMDSPLSIFRRLGELGFPQAPRKEAAKRAIIPKPTNLLVEPTIPYPPVSADQAAENEQNNRKNHSTSLSARTVPHCFSNQKGGL